jgi:succinoglycan biosynthesis protein ExoA
MAQSSFSLAANCTQILTTEGSDRMHADCIVVVPALNEEKYISRCIESLLHQSISEFPVIVADGGSTDRTRGIVTDIMKREPRVQFIKIPGSQACAVNAVARQTGEGVKWLIRADAHAVYPAHFVEALIAAARQTRASTVVVPMRTVGHGCFQRAAAAAQNSRLGNGGALHRRGKSSRFVDHGHHALFELEHFRRVGGYDETSSGNEDFELDHRSREAGGTVWLASEASIDYISRDSLWALARQYFRHGQGRAQTIVKHTIIRRTLFPKVRQILPVVVLGLYVVGIGLSPWVPVAMLLPAGHLMTCLFWGAFLGLRERDLCCAASGICAAVMHLAWAIGLCAGLAKHIKTHRTEIPLLARLRLSK